MKGRERMFIKLTAVKTNRQLTGKDITEKIDEIESAAQENEVDRRYRRQLHDEMIHDIGEALETDDLDRMAFELKGYHYDRKNSRIVLYTPFEYRIYIPANREKYLRFIEEADISESQGRAYTCEMPAYYSDPDFATGRSTIPVLNLGMKYLFN